MKKHLALIIALCFVFVSQSYGQTYNMSNDTVTTCAGTFYDNGGLGLYTANQSLTKTFTPGLPGRAINIRFTSFQTQAGSDILCVYDGPSTASPLIGCYSGNNTLNGISFKSSHPSGSLTFTFISNASTQLNGWSATISCVFSCQNFTVIADSTIPVADTADEIKICVGTAVSMVGNANYPNNGNYYNQSNATSTFTWKTGDGFSIPGINATHTFTTPGIFDLSLVVSDTIGCTQIMKGNRVVVSTAPNFQNVEYVSSDSICLGDSVTIIVPDSGLFTPYNPPSLNAAGVTFLPDGSGVSYFDTINVSIFAPTATHQNNFLKDIYVNMEHSYLGDLDIQITCPNGQTAILKQTAGGLGTHLGEPVDPPTVPVPLNPGVGYTYEFTNLSPTYGTMVAESGNYSHNYTDVLGNNYTAQDYLPAGTYTPFQVLNTQLNGCPLNGNWILRVRDNIAIDNGYIFFWGLNFDTLIRPPLSVPTTITASRVSSRWTSVSSMIGPTNDTAILTSPTTSGTHYYRYEIVDDFGCLHDTTLEIYVKPKPKSNAGVDFTTCLLNYTLAPVATAGATSNSWNYYSTSLTGTSIISNNAIFAPTTTVNEFSTFNYVLQETVDGCLTYPDTVTISHVQVQNTIDIGISKDTICLPEAVTFTNNSDMTYFDSVYWNFGDGNLSNTQGSVTHNYATPNCYNLTVSLVNSLGCRVDSVLPNVVCAYPTPVANFIYDPTESIIPNTLVNFTNTSLGGTIYSWDIAGFRNSTNTNESYEFPKTDGGIYPVTLTVSNEGGCTDQITKNVTIKNPLNIWIPNSFTPNEDGLNDVFSVVFNNNSVENYSIHIFNRWGELMFYSEELNFEWDGTHNGEKAPNGTYVWKIIGKEQFATDSFTKIGHVILTR